MSNARVQIPRRGLMFVLSSPSGAGKSTLARLLLSEEKDLSLSISVTTRPRRHSEVEGQHYFFIDQPTFLRMREHDELLESAEVHGNFYGTPRAAVEKALAAGKDVFSTSIGRAPNSCRASKKFGAISCASLCCRRIFANFSRRLERRAEDAPEAIQRRLANAREEIGKWGEYDYVIINEDLDWSFPMARAILAAERLKRERMVGSPALSTDC